MKNRPHSLVVTLLLVGCTSSMHGVAHSPEGLPLGRATAEYTGSGVGSGSLRVTLPDGEVFNGPWSATTASTWDAGQYSSGYYYGSGRMTSNMYAALVGDHGHSMQCLFQGDEMSGRGQCQVSDGRVVDLVW